MIISISGPAGSGTTTIAKLLSERYGYEHVYAGQMMRVLAKQKGMTIYEFNDYVTQHPEIDIQVDDTIVSKAKEGNKIVEGRLSAWMMVKNHIPAFKVYFTIDPKVAAARVAQRDAISPEEAFQRNIEREHSHWARFKKIYKVDRDDTSIYDLILDTTELSIEMVLLRVLQELDRHGRPAKHGS